MTEMFEIAKFLHDDANVNSKRAMTKTSIFSLNKAEQKSNLYPDLISQVHI